MIAQEAYLRAILATVARQTFSPDNILKIMGPNAGERQYLAFNLCDGTRTQAEVAREVGLDSGNFSKSLGRWIDAGIIVRIGEGRDSRPIHVYPLPESHLNKASKQ